MADTRDTPSKEALDAACQMYAVQTTPEGRIDHAHRDAALTLDAFAAPYKAEVAALIDENSDLRNEPWPEWATTVLKVIRERTGYDGYDDAEGVDLPGELNECMAELERMAERETQEARAKFLTDDVERKAERYKAQSAARGELLAKAEAERDALAAQVAALREALIGAMGLPDATAEEDKAIRDHIRSTLANADAHAHRFRQEAEAHQHRS